MRPCPGAGRGGAGGRRSAALSQRSARAEPPLGWTGDRLGTVVRFWFELLCDIYFWVDIVINFRTAYRVNADDPSSGPPQMQL